MHALAIDKIAMFQCCDQLKHKINVSDRYGSKYILL